MKTSLFWTGIAGLTGVVLGALGAHQLKDFLMTRGTTSIWETAVFYHLIHSVAAFSIALFSQAKPLVEPKWITRAGTLWLIGISLFSGSLYVLALGSPKWLGPVTPLGGLFLLAGWSQVLIGACNTKAVK